MACDPSPEGVDPTSSQVACQDGSVVLFDEDGDGFFGSSTDCTADELGLLADCDDANPDVHPEADEYCDGDDNDCDETVDEDPMDGQRWYWDGDGDGYGAGEGEASCSEPEFGGDTEGGYVEVAGDCDDRSAEVNPGAEEVCDGLDNNCDEEIDEASAVDAPIWYWDGDGDGYGDEDESQTQCSPPEGYVAEGGDCDDDDGDLNPETLWYADEDGDGYGNGGESIEACFPGSGYVQDDTDCNDGDPLINPGAEEPCTATSDLNCDGSLPEEDRDGDGYLACVDDCDDGEANINPDAVEVCDTVDNNCNELVDEGVQTTFYADEDEDGYGNEEAPVLACDLPLGASTTSDDCDDTDGTAFPGGEEVCDEADNDCDRTVDEGVQTTYYKDQDEDGVGDENNPKMACEVAPDGYVAEQEVGFDCKPLNNHVYPGKTETCDDLDEDCDEIVDEGSQTTYYQDGDGDGFGDPMETDERCKGNDDWLLNDEDCDDGDSSINPDATEVCNGTDDDCDRLIDDADSDVEGAPSWWSDGDGDNHGKPGGDVLTQCMQPTGYAGSDDDCDDDNGDAYPGAPESCNSSEDLNCDGDLVRVDEDGDGVATCEDDCDDDDPNTYPPFDGKDGAPELCNEKDNDCDGTVDEGAQTTYYDDGDNDGFGDPEDSTLACTVPNGYVDNDDDCDDGYRNTNPGADERCDDLDNDCDEAIDELDPAPIDAGTYYYDLDGDTYPDTRVEIIACTQPAETIPKDETTPNDCDDENVDVNPARTEVCNGIDDDCDTLVDDADGSVDSGTQKNWYLDSDGDGHGTGSPTLACDRPSDDYYDEDTDCDDTDEDVNPDAVEICDPYDADEDCNELSDDDDRGDPEDPQYPQGAVPWYLDADGDGYGVEAGSVERCDAPTDSYVDQSGDCRPEDPSVHPGAGEQINGIDDDCDGLIDED